MDGATTHDKPGTYHHGDLRAALIEAGLQELEATGTEAFSLRKVARRAGVSHAAPAHHFGDVTGLLTALAAEGFRRFVVAMETRQATAESKREKLLASGLGYLDFAIDSPALFRLIHSSTRPDDGDPDLAGAAGNALQHLFDAVTAVTGNSLDDPETWEDTAAVWAMVHGISDLVLSGRLKHIVAMRGDERDAAVKRLLMRSLMK